MKKTNKAIFLEELSACTDSQTFVDMISSGKCSHCSNHYWDMGQSKCHKNINESSCEKGQAEYFESSPEEDLQIKYRKKYWSCENVEDAYNKLNLIRTLHKAGVIEKAECCQRCLNKESFRSCEACDITVNQLQRMYGSEIRRQDVERSKYPFKRFLQDKIIPAIKDEKLRKEAVAHMKICYPEK